MQLKFNRTDKLILSFALAVMCVFSYFLYDDSFLFRDRESRNAKIGNLRTAENDVRLRASDSFTWNSAKKAEVVFERDSVFTGKRSQTQIDLVDGSKIFLNENSLVTLIAKNGKLELNLRYGNIQAEIKKSSKLELKAASQQIILKKESDSSKLEIKKPKYGLTKIKLLEGKVSVVPTATSRTEELLKQQTVIVKPAGTIQKSAPGSITLTTADKSQFYVTPTTKSFYLDWNSQGTEQNTVSVSKDKEFKTVVLTEANIKTKVLVKELPVGMYYWRISGHDLNNTPVQTEIRTFTVHFMDKLTIVEPLEAQKYEVEVKGDVAAHKQPVKVSWTNIYDDAQLQIASSPDFQVPLVDKELTKAFNWDGTFSMGTYFIRVRGKNQTHYSDWSDTRSFTIAVKLKSFTKPETPVLLSKKLTFNSSQSRSPSSVNPTVVKWQPTPSTAKYEVEVSLKDPKFSKPMKLTSKTAELNFVPKTAGLHYYRVRAINSNNIPGDFSDVGEVQTKLIAPKLNNVNSIQLRSNNPNETAPETKFKVSWTPVYLADKYTMEIAENPDFKDSQTVPATTTETEFKTSKPGNYYFRIIASDTTQEIKSETSNVQNSNYEFIKRLPKPNLIEPKNKMTVFLQKEIEPFIWLNWESAIDQDNYEIEIALDKSFSRMVTQKTLTEKKFLIKTKLPLGKVYWRVRQLDTDPKRISEWTQPREFQLIHNKNEGVFK